MFKREGKGKKLHTELVGHRKLGFERWYRQEALSSKEEGEKYVSDARARSSRKSLELAYFVVLDDSQAKEVDEIHR
jgi:hypothetical protein